MTFNSFQGIRGFWKGVTASYWGISETVIHFVIYEYLKKQLAMAQKKRKTDEKTFLDFAGFMLCGACSKTCATIVAYPHGKTNDLLYLLSRHIGNIIGCLFSKGNQAITPKFERPNGKNMKSKFFLKSVKNWCHQLT